MGRYNFEEDDSWIVGQKSIHNCKPQFMRRFRTIVFLTMMIEFNIFIFWLGFVFLLGGIDAWLVLFPSFLIPVRTLVLFYTMIFEKQPYKIASAEFRHIEEDGFPRNQYSCLRVVGSHGAWGGHGVWNALGKYAQMPILFFSVLAYSVTLLFREGSDTDLLFFNLVMSFFVFFDTLFLDIFLVNLGVKWPRDNYYNAPEEGDADFLNKDFI